ncbi:MerR family transcriptional regulator [Fundicoccus culcitae]|uniref:MerR family transcriptional regulator n=1 Tax=Fundicoccus culcitae TaxID=2969821 RepID=A0ABY5P4Q3_9LACT|nr:MerR family transcriptional regulator [Fundicoccus culcitae]UUX33672.1 MerR family transcriptional regulator [Fundicoccus culcitae]
MPYTIGQLARLTGVTTRTLRHYDAIGLLKPSEVLENGYRIYHEDDVARLHQILVYRELGFELNAIKDILTTDQYNRMVVMENHLDLLAQEKQRIEALIQSVELAMQKSKEGLPMSEQDFDVFKREKIAANEAQYGEEIREKYGAEVVEKSNQHFSKMDKDSYAKIEALTVELGELLAKHVADNHPLGDAGQLIAKKHAEFLKAAWPDGLFSQEAHLGLVEMYTLDDRFKAYYDAFAEGATDYLYAAVVGFYWVEE